MGTTINRRAYQQMVEEDLAWLSKMPHSLERMHIEQIVRWSVDALYDAEEYVGDVRLRPGAFEALVERIVREMSAMPESERCWCGHVRRDHPVTGPLADGGCRQCMCSGFDLNLRGGD